MEDGGGKGIRKDMGVKEGVDIKGNGGGGVLWEGGEEDSEEGEGENEGEVVGVFVVLWFGINFWE